jgi:antitoxin HigA-1
MPMRDPSHLGGFIRREILEPLGLSVTEAASALDVTRQTLSNLVNEKAMLTADMALRLEKAFGVSMELLMRMQLAYDLAQARARAGTIKVKRYKTALRQAS